MAEVPHLITLDEENLLNLHSSPIQNSKLGNPKKIDEDFFLLDRSIEDRRFDLNESDVSFIFPPSDNNINALDSNTNRDSSSRGGKESMIQGPSSAYQGLKSNPDGEIKKVDEDHYTMSINVHVPRQIMNHISPISLNISQSINPNTSNFQCSPNTSRRLYMSDRKVPNDNFAFLSSQKSPNNTENRFHDAQPGNFSSGSKVETGQRGKNSKSKADKNKGDESKPRTSRGVTKRTRLVPNPSGGKKQLENKRTKQKRNKKPVGKKDQLAQTSAKKIKNKSGVCHSKKCNVCNSSSEDECMSCVDLLSCSCSTCSSSFSDF